MPLVSPALPVVPRPGQARGRPAWRKGGLISGAPLVAPTIRYVRKTGSDSNGGTSPSDAWLTIGKALTTVSSNTWVYVGAGVYREVVTVTITPTSEVRIIGDVDGWRTGDPGMVQWTAYTTSDKAAPSATALLTLAGKSNLTFQNIVLVGGNTTMIDGSTATSQAITFTNCALLAQGSIQVLIQATCAFGVPFNWTLDRCRFITPVNGAGICARLTLATGVGADYDTNFVVTNSWFMQQGSAAIQVQNSGSAANKGNGAKIRNCTFVMCGALVTSSNISTLIPSTVTDCFIYSGNAAGLNANASGHIIEDYNLIVSTTPRTNVSVGTHSISDLSYAPLFHFGQEAVWGGSLRPFGEPMQSSPLNAFGSDGNQTPYDIRGGPRPTLATRPAVGAYQRGNNAVKETVVTNDGSVAISFTGDGFQDYDVAVDAGPLTISAYCDYDSSYAGPLPRLMVVANLELGVGQTEVPFSTTSLNAFAQASLTINPTGSGVITVRLISGDTSGASKVAFDTFAPV